MHKCRSPFFHGLINELVDQLETRVLLIEELLVISLLPRKADIVYTNWFPMVWHVATNSVNHVRDFVGHDEFKVLGGKFVAEK
jgi:hypothetical protein